jgi:hypothetical protein
MQPTGKRDHAVNPVVLKRGKTAGKAGTDLSHPNLCVRVPGEEPIRGRDLVPVDLVIGGLDVDERILSFICGTQERENGTTDAT